MKHMYAVLALLLVLVFALGSSVPAGVLRGEDYDRPVDNTVVGGGGGEDDDHPWGGDRVIGDPDGGVTDKYVYTSALTGYALADLLLQSLITCVDSDFYSTGTTAVTQIESLSSSTVYRRSVPAATTSSRDRNWKAERR